MGLPAEKVTKLSYAEYKAIEDASDERHDFWDGEMFAMSGASPDHYALESAIHGALFSQLGKNPCRAYTGNMRLRSLDSDNAVYADTVVVCGPRQVHPDDPCAITNPSVVVEVLSPSTEAYDRGAKFALYRGFPSITDVVFVSQQAIAIEHYSRDPAGGWRLTDLGRADALAFPALGVSIPVEAIYADTALLAPPAA